jgi:hypothetical protein
MDFYVTFLAAQRDVCLACAGALEVGHEPAVSHRDVSPEATRCQQA